MSAQALLEDLQSLGVVLEDGGGLLHVDAPAGVLNEERKATLAEHKQGLIKLLQREREERKLEEASRGGLVIQWSKEPGYIALHDPLTGEWHEVPASGCLPSVVEAANASHRHNRGTRGDRKQNTTGGER